MTRFRYSATDATGRVRRGLLDAADAQAARGGIRQKGLLPLTVSPAREWSLAEIAPDLRRNRKLSQSDLSIFTRQMATLLNSGVQVETALAALGAQATPRLAALCQGVRNRVLDGSSFSAALRAEGRGFDRYILTSIEAGERAGRPAAVLNHLADHAEAQQRNRQTVLLALIYPAILIVVSLAVVIGLLVFLLPDIVRVFAARGAELPPLTRVMIGFSDFVSGNLLLLLLGALAFGGAAMLALRDQGLRSRAHRCFWRLALARQVVMVQFTGTLATLTQSGVPLVEAMTSATATVGNDAARQVLGTVTQDVRDGLALSRALERHRGFDPMIITMLASGEASGTLPVMLDRYAQDQALSLQARVKTLIGLVEPMVLLSLGGVVMLMVLAILMPIVNLNSLVT
ncbi:MAG: type II secretion system F family protein [Pseudomonadota bacterium]